jgi:organic radical activating enzyme
MTHPKLHKEKLLLSGDGVFETIQGEGPSIQTPSVFIRLHSCNLHCVFEGGQICDSWYTWKTDTKEYLTEWSLISVEELLKEVLQYKSRNIVFTGGEPLLQQKQILQFMQLFRTKVPSNERISFEIETNATIKPLEQFEVYTQAHVLRFNCSPKLSSSGNDTKLSIKRNVLQYFNTLNSVFKFVVTKDSDIEEIEHLQNQIPLSKEKIWIMPEGTDSADIIDKTRNLVKIAIEKQWHVTTRLQVILWGNKRRV